MPNTYELFNGVTDIKADFYSQNLLYGITDWCRWASLQGGAFQNVIKGQSSGLYGGHPSILRPVSTPNYNNGQVWEGIRSDWVWETGLSYSVTPRDMSGVYVNDTFYDTSTTSGTYAHHVNYPLGRVVFDTAIPTGSNVKADYSFRTISFAPTKEPWLQELLYGSLEIERSDFYVMSSGSHSQLSHARRQMPAVGIELSTRRGYSPFQLGGGQYIYQDIIYYVLAENSEDRNQLLDILSNQNDKTIWIPDRKMMKENAGYPHSLDYRGVPVSSPKQFPDLILPTGEGGFRWSKIRFTNTTSQPWDTVNGWLYRGEVKTTCEAIFENI